MEHSEMLCTSSKRKSYTLWVTSASTLEDMILNSSTWGVSTRTSMSKWSFLVRILGASYTPFAVLIYSQNDTMHESKSADMISFRIS